MLGILGGMGPLASAAFVHTLYEYNLSEPEQGSPGCILYSDPAFPDRTDAVLDPSRDGPVRERLGAAVERLVGMGADRVVIACVTMHHFLPALPGALRERVVSLVDVGLREVAQRGGRWLLLATDGSRAGGVFQASALWPDAARAVVLPDDADQALVHGWVYRLKRGHAPGPLLPAVAALVKRYGADGFVAGCTEFHLLTRALRLDPAAGALAVVDPLEVVARQLATR